MTESISSTEFREALAHFASGVTVVTASDKGGLVGFTATAFSSLSLSPPLLLVCVAKKASAHDRIVEAEAFGVNVLAERQAWIAEQFARPGIDRFLGIPLAAGESSRAPLIEDALVRLECERYARHEAGDHTILVGRVLAGATASGRPLLHYARRFGGFVADSAPPAGAAKDASKGGEA
jgi:flavin reductase ActVB